MSKKVAIAKTITWRTMSSVFTLVSSYIIISNNKNASIGTIAGYITISEVVTKMILYYVHERMWEYIKSRYFRSSL